MLSVLISPHQNSRYQASLDQLSLAEMELTLKSIGLDCPVESRVIAGRTALCAEPGEREAEAAAALSRMAAVYMIARQLDGGALLPLYGRCEPFIGDDISGILKYKGKTNETFTRMLLNVARCSGKFTGDEPLDVLDPVCGKGTTLLEALNMGHNCVGVDIDAKGAAELEAFARRYMTYNRMKHTLDHASLTMDGKPTPMWTLTTAKDNAAWKSGDRRSMSVITADTLTSDRLLGKRRFHIIAGDLPYGVQHAAYSTDKKAGTRISRLERFAAEAIRVWSGQLTQGGVMALSFNTFTLKRDFVRQAMADAGLNVCAGGAYDGMEHWVEQAVNRDVAVGVR